ncbi:TPA: hypothetical protein DCX16_04885 [bacterium]|nr:hypothetical protein [bacterium]
MPGHWKEIKLSNSGANGSKISYCDIGYAKQAIYLENASGIVITNNFIHDNKGNDGAFSGYPGPPGDIGCGIYLLSSTGNTIIENTISQVTRHRWSRRISRCFWFWRWRCHRLRNIPFVINK